MHISTHTCVSVREKLSHISYIFQERILNLMGKSEGKIEDYLLAQACRNGCLCYKFTSPGTNGVPDRVIFIPPNKTIFVEVKAPEGHLRPLQKIMIKNMVRHGAVVFVTYTKPAVDILYDFVLNNSYEFICNQANIPDIIKPETYF